MDPDGRIQRKYNGAVIVIPIDNPLIEIGNSKSKIKVVWGYIKTNDGTEILIRINLSSQRREDFNCHGYTFSNGLGWIQPDQVNKILKGDGYKETINPEPGGIFVQFAPDGTIYHSGRIIQYNKAKEEITVREALGVAVFYDKDGNLRNTRVFTYKLKDMGYIRFYTNTGDEYVE